MYYYFSFCGNFSTDVKTLWMLWQHGNSLEHIGPYRGLRGYDLDNNDGTDLSKARIVMSALGKFCLINFVDVSDFII
jgi:hypothetical protein